MSLLCSLLGQIEANNAVTVLVGTLVGDGAVVLREGDEVLRLGLGSPGRSFSASSSKALAVRSSHSR